MLFIDKKNHPYSKISTCLQTFIRLPCLSLFISRLPAQIPIVTSIKNAILHNQSFRSALPHNFFYDIQLTQDDKLNAIESNENVVESLIDLFINQADKSNSQSVFLEQICGIPKEYTYNGCIYSSLPYKYSCSPTISRIILFPNTNEILKFEKWPLMLIMHINGCYTYAHIRKNISLRVDDRVIDYNIQTIVIEDNMKKLFLFVKNIDSNWLCINNERINITVDNALKLPSMRILYFIYSRDIECYQSEKMLSNFMFMLSLYNNFRQNTMKIEYYNSSWFDKFVKVFTKAEKKLSDSENLILEPKFIKDHNYNAINVTPDEFLDASNAFIKYYNSLNKPLILYHELFENFLCEIHSLEISLSFQRKSYSNLSDGVNSTSVLPNKCKCEVCSYFFTYGGEKIPFKILIDLDLPEGETYSSAIEKIYSEDLNFSSLKSNQIHKSLTEDFKNYLIMTLFTKISKETGTLKENAIFKISDITELKKKMIVSVEKFLMPKFNKTVTYKLIGILVLYAIINECQIIVKQSNLWGLIQGKTKYEYQSLEELLNSILVSENATIYLFYSEDHPKLYQIVSKNPSLSKISPRFACHFLTSTIFTLSTLNQFLHDLLLWPCDNNWVKDLKEFAYLQLHKSTFGKLPILNSLQFFINTNLSKNYSNKTCLCLDWILKQIHEANCSYQFPCPSCKNFLISMSNEGPKYSINQRIKKKGGFNQNFIKDYFIKQDNYSPPINIITIFDNNRKNVEIDKLFEKCREINIEIEGRSYVYEIRALIMTNSIQGQSFVYSPMHEKSMLLSDRVLNPLGIVIKDFVVEGKSFIPKGLIYCKTIPIAEIQMFMSNICIAMLGIPLFYNILKDTDNESYIKSRYFNNYIETFNTQCKPVEIDECFIRGLLRYENIMNLKDAFCCFITHIHSVDPSSTTNKCKCYGCKLFCCKFTENNSQNKTVTLDLSVYTKNVLLQFNPFSQEFNLNTNEGNSQDDHEIPLSIGSNTSEKTDYSDNANQSKTYTIYKISKILIISLASDKDNTKIEHFKQFLIDHQKISMKYSHTIYKIDSIILKHYTENTFYTCVQNENFWNIYLDGILKYVSPSISNIYDANYIPILAFYSKKDVIFIRTLLKVLYYLPSFRYSVLGYSLIKEDWYEMLKGFFCKPEKFDDPLEVYEFFTCFNQNSHIKMQNAINYSDDIEYNLTLLLNRIHSEICDESARKCCPSCENFLIAGECNRDDSLEFYELNTVLIHNFLVIGENLVVGGNVLSYYFSDGPIKINYKLKSYPKCLFYRLHYEKYEQNKEGFLRRFTQDNLIKSLILNCSEDNTVAIYNLQCIIFIKKNLGENENKSENKRGKYILAFNLNRKNLWSFDTTKQNCLFDKIIESLFDYYKILFVPLYLFYSIIN